MSHRNSASETITITGTENADGINLRRLLWSDTTGLRKVQRTRTSTFDIRELVGTGKARRNRWMRSRFCESMAKALRAYSASGSSRIRLRADLASHSRALWRSSDAL